MTILSSILKNAMSSEELLIKTTGYRSPPPESLHNIKPRRRKRRHSKYKHIEVAVDDKPPPLNPDHYFKPKRLYEYKANMFDTHVANLKLLRNIFCIYKEGGKVDCWWRQPPPKFKSLHTDERELDARNINRDNLNIYKRLQKTGPKVESVRELALDWKKNKQRIVEAAHMPFVLFDPRPKYLCQDPAFECPKNVTRPRVQLEMTIRNGCHLGRLLIELFTDVCPNTCALFSTLLKGDTVGHSYVGTQFFRMVPGLYWSGGDVTHNNGFGCYREEGHCRPIGAESYHFSHTMPGLLSMRVTEFDEVCGHFNIMFKAMPQFDLKNVIFGRVLDQENLRVMAEFGSDSVSRPHVLIGATHYTEQGSPRTGRPNVKKRDDAYWSETRWRLKEYRATLKYNTAIPSHLY